MCIKPHKYFHLRFGTALGFASYEKMSFFELGSLQFILSKFFTVYDKIRVDLLWSTGQDTRLPCERSTVRIRLGTHHSRRKLWIANHVQWSFWEDKNPCWVPCADGIKLQSLRSFRFWTSLVRKNCHDISGAMELWWLLAIGKASSFGAGLDISMSRQLKTKTKN